MPLENWRNSMRLIVSLLGSAICLMPAMAAEADLDKERLHALMSCRTLMQVAAASGQFETAPTIDIIVFSVKLKSAGELTMFAAQIPPQEQTELWAFYENEVHALAAANEAGFWGAYDGCFSDAHVLEALNSPGF